MAFKVHPKAFRIERNEDWNSRWLNEKKLPELLEEDFKIREFLKKKLEDCSVEKIIIERFPGQIKVIIFTSRPGLIIGRRGEGAELLKKVLENKILKKKGVLKLEIKAVKNVWSSAPLTAQWIAKQIEKRVRYRRVLKSALGRIITSKEVKGARVQIQGRLNGTMIARRDALQKGQLPRQKIRAIIDYGTARAFCTYGVVGVKVWIHKGEKLE